MHLSKHTKLPGEELTEAVLLDATIYGPDAEEIGSVSHVQGSGPGANVVVDVGGFLGIGAKPVAVSASELNFMRDEVGAVLAFTTWTEEELKEMPEYREA
jgi:PRC-barrel domain